MRDWTGKRLGGAVALGLGAVAMAALGGGVALASAQGGTIHSCVAKSDGALRVVGSAGDCTSHETALSFNKRGPRGPQGPQGAPGTSGGSGGGSGTFQMYANVDQEGDLGSNFDAVKAAKLASGGATFYSVEFSQPIGSCAAEAQAGYAGGNLEASSDASVVIPDPQDPDAYYVQFITSDNSADASAFMMTVTCKS